MIEDVRYALRLFARRPVWSLAILGVLAIGIGANTAMFSAFEAWVLRPLDFERPTELVVIHETQPRLGRDRLGTSARAYGVWMAEQRSFAAMGAFRRHRYNLNDDEPVRLDGALVSASLFALLGKEPILGRSFERREDLPGNPLPVALLSHQLWVERYEGDPRVVGRSIRLDGRTHEIVGVMQPGFAFPEWADVWTPLGVDIDSGELEDRSLTVVARPREGVSVESARRDLSAIASRLESRHPQNLEGFTTQLISLRQEFVPPVIRLALTASLASGIFVLLVICANVASLMLAQATARSRETALRAALGASRLRLVRQSLVEGLVLAVPSGVFGAYLGMLGIESMLAYVPVDPPYLFTMKLDASAGLYTLVVALIAGVLCGLAPVARSSGPRLHEALKSGGRQTGARAGKRLRAGLVVAEVGLSTALVVGALLMVKSFLALSASNPGFRIENVLTAEISLEGEIGTSAEQRVRFTERILRALSAVPDVVAVTAASDLPASQGYVVRGVVAEEGMPPRGEDVNATVHATTGTYFETLDIPLDKGRTFTASETREGGEVAIVSRSLARALWGGREPVGRRLRTGAANTPWLTVVGVVGDVDVGRDMVSFGQTPRAQLYVPYARLGAETVSVAIRSDAPVGALTEAVREVFRSSAPGIPLSRVVTMEEAIFRIRWVSRFFSRQLVLYAALATLIAAIGLYGLTADAVSRRTRELAVRVAFGADRTSLIRLVVRETLFLGGAGVGLGLGFSLVVTRFLSAMFAGVTARDPAVFAGVGVLLFAVTFVAALLPARQATALEPVAALRSE